MLTEYLYQSVDGPIDDGTLAHLQAFVALLRGAPVASSTLPVQVFKMMELNRVHGSFYAGGQALHPVEAATEGLIEWMEASRDTYVEADGLQAQRFMNGVLLTSGFPIVTLPFSRWSKDFHRAVRACRRYKKPDPLRLLIAQLVRMAFFRYLALLSGDTSTPESFSLRKIPFGVKGQAGQRLLEHNTRLSADAVDQGKGRYFYERVNALLQAA